jgi:hypothetical protein
MIALFITMSFASVVPSTNHTVLTLVKQRWEERLAAAGGKPIVAEHYPTEQALVFLSAYSITRDQRYAAQAALQMEYAHLREKNGVFVTSEQTTTRDYQARQIYNFYLAYRILADGRYLRWADDCAVAMIRVIPRAPHTAAGETHTTFEAGFFTADGKRAHDNAQVIDVNQNAEIALAYSLLHYDPASKFFRDPLAKEIAFEELLASMSIQNMSTGEIPLTENIAGADTAYGSYAAFSWVWCQLLWRDERLEPHVQAAGRWLAPKTDLSRDSQRWYPQRIENGPVPDWEICYRLPLLWYCKVEAREVTNQLAPTASLYWGYYHLMGLPRDYFLPRE